MFRQGDVNSIMKRSEIKIASFAASIVSDLSLLLLFLLVSSAIILIPGTEGSIVRAIIGFVLVLFVTGYALIAVVFPRKGSINGYERFVMSVAASICITPLIGFLLNYTEWGIRLEPVMICLITFTFLCVVIASLRRHRLHPEDRFSPDILQFCKGTVAFFFPSSDGSKLNRALSVLFILALLSTTLTVVLALNVPNNQENFTELYTLSPNHTLTNQSKLFFVGQTQPVIVGIVNHEHKDVTYTLDATLDDGSNRTLLHTQQISLAHNQTWENPVNLTTDRTGIDMKLAFTLYKDGDLSAPYREVYTLVDSVVMGEKFTGFQVLGYNNSSLDLNKNPLKPAKFILGGHKPYYITVYNHDGRTVPVPYTIMVTLSNETNTTVLLQENIELSYNKTYLKQKIVTPDKAGQNMLLKFLLFKDNDFTVPYKEESVFVTVSVPLQAPANATAAIPETTVASG